MDWRLKRCKDYDRPIGRACFTIQRSLSIRRLIVDLCFHCSMVIRKIYRGHGGPLLAFENTHSRGNIRSLPSGRPPLLCRVFPYVNACHRHESSESVVRGPSWRKDVRHARRVTRINACVPSFTSCECVYNHRKNTPIFTAFRRSNRLSWYILLHRSSRFFLPSVPSLDRAERSWRCLFIDDEVIIIFKCNLSWLDNSLEYFYLIIVKIINARKRINQ